MWLFIKSLLLARGLFWVLNEYHVHTAYTRAQTCLFHELHLYVHTVFGSYAKYMSSGLLLSLISQVSPFQRANGLLVLLPWNGKLFEFGRGAVDVRLTHRSGIVAHHSSRAGIGQKARNPTATRRWWVVTGNDDQHMLFWSHTTASQSMPIRFSLSVDCKNPMEQTA